MEGGGSGGGGGVRLHVGGLGESVGRDDLLKIFSPMGSVEAVEFVRTKGRSFAYIDFSPASENSLTKLFSTYNGCKWKGGKLRLEKAKEHYMARLKREWAESASVSASDETVKAPENATPSTHLNIFFPRLRKVKAMPLSGTGKHKYSFQRVAVSSLLPKTFCDCEEHSASLTPQPTHARDLEALNVGINEQEVNIMNSVMNKLLAKADSSIINEKDEIVINVVSNGKDMMDTELDILSRKRKSMLDQTPASGEGYTEGPKGNNIHPNKKRQAIIPEESGRLEASQAISEKKKPSKVDQDEPSRTTGVKRSNDNISWSQKSSWKALVSNGNTSSFSVSSFLPDVSASKAVQPAWDNTDVKGSDHSESEDADVEGSDHSESEDTNVEGSDRSESEDAVVEGSDHSESEDADVEGSDHSESEDTNVEGSDHSESEDAVVEGSDHSESEDADVEGSDHSESEDSNVEGSDHSESEDAVVEGSDHSESEDTNVEGSDHSESEDAVVEGSDHSESEDAVVEGSDHSESEDAVVEGSDHSESEDAVVEGSDHSESEDVVVEGSDHSESEDAVVEGSDHSESEDAVVEGSDHSESEDAVVEGSDHSEPEDAVVEGSDHSEPEDAVVEGSEHSESEDTNVEGSEHSESEDANVEGSDHSEPEDADVEGSDHSEPEDADVVGSDHSEPEDADVVGSDHSEPEDTDVADMNVDAETVELAGSIEGESEDDSLNAEKDENVAEDSDAEKERLALEDSVDHDVDQEETEKGQLEACKKSAGGSLWLQKASWTQLVRDQNASFSITQLFPNLPSEKSEADRVNNSGDDGQFFNSNQSGSGMKQREDSCSTNGVEAAVVHGASSSTPLRSIKENQQTVNARLGVKKPIRREIGSGETCTFMRSDASVNEWKRAKKALGGPSRKKKTEE